MAAQREVQFIWVVTHPFSEIAFPSVPAGGLVIGREGPWVNSACAKSTALLEIGEKLVTTAGFRLKNRRKALSSILFSPETLPESGLRAEQSGETK